MAVTIRFNDEQIARLREAQRAIHDALPLLDSAERCGVNCTGPRQILSTLREVLANLEGEFVARESE